MPMTERQMYYDRKGNPITQQQWIDAAGEDNTVKKTTVGEVNVSTIYLALNHQYGDGPPLIFETICFEGAPRCECCGQKTDEDPQFRYATEVEAIAHHDAIVEALRKGEPLPDESELTNG